MNEEVGCAARRSGYPVDGRKDQVARKFDAYGTRFELQSDEPILLEEAWPYLPLGWQATDNGAAEFSYSLLRPCVVEANPPDAAYELYAGSELIARTSDRIRLLRVLAEHAELTTILHAQNRLFVHAGVVGWRGQAILVPGRSLAGKTTLVRALVEAGAAYYADEFAVLDRRGWVHPYALSLSIRSADGRADKTPIEQLGGVRGVTPLPVGLIVVTHYIPRARWRPRPVPPSQAMLALMDNTVAARREPEYSMPILRETVLRAKTVKSKRGEARRIAPALLQLADL
jgi:hypothetical protein